MLEKIPTEQELRALVGEAAYAVTLSLRTFLHAHYDVDVLWDKGGKAATCQCRYRRGGKTLCTLLYKPGEAACMLVFGAQEREKAERIALSPAARMAYDAATTYHDGKWVWFTLAGESILSDIELLLPVKRRFMK